MPRLEIADRILALVGHRVEGRQRIQQPEETILRGERQPLDEWHRQSHARDALIGEAAHRLTTFLPRKDEPDRAFVEVLVPYLLPAGAKPDIGEDGQTEVEVVQHVHHAAVFLLQAASTTRLGISIAANDVVEEVALYFGTEAVTDTGPDAGLAREPRMEPVIMIG